MGKEKPFCLIQAKRGCSFRIHPFAGAYTLFAEPNTDRVVSSCFLAMDILLPAIDFNVDYSEYFPP